MAMLKRRDKGRIDKRQSLAGIPIMNPDVKLLEAQGSPTFLTYKMRRGHGLLDRFRPEVMDKRCELDEFGTFVIRHIDSERTVLDIVNLFQEHFGMSRRESELGVVAFIKILMQRSLITVVLKTRS